MQKKKSLSFLHLLLSVVALLLFISITGCAGGGSSGTGTGGSFRFSGKLQSEDGDVIAGAMVTLLETGDVDVSDEVGEFEFIIPEEEEGDLTLEVDTGEDVSTIEITAGSGDDFLIITIKENPNLETIEPETVTMRGKIVGTCDLYFENFITIRQSNKAPDGVECTARVVVQSNGVGLAHVPVAIQYSNCRGRDWTTIALGATMTGGNIGIAQVQFPFTDSRDRCLYRIVAPFELDTLPSISQFIHTDTFQERN